MGMTHRLIFVALALAPMFVHAQDKGMVQAAEAACGPKGAHLKARFIPEVGEIAQAAAGVAQVYVIDPAHWPTPHLQIGVDGKWSGLLRGRSHLMLTLPPGAHHFCARIPSGFMRNQPSVFSMHLVKDETAYLFVAARHSTSDEDGVSPFVAMRQMNNDEGRFEVISTRRSVPGGQP